MIYPNLPIVERKDDICQAILEHPVVIIAGETGSGKTTQLGKMALAIGRGEKGWIGHTQPRRLAASAVARKIAEELNSPLGTTVGYKVRFSDKTSPETKIKLMTDGILLAETARDRLLKRYDTIIIDEAHERSLNIDFLLGMLKNILQKREDLKIIVTSATIDVEKFSAFFNDAPIIEVSGRTYPVEVRYRLNEDSTRSLADNIYAAVQEINGIGTGDVLVFLSGEREIRDVHAHLRNSFHNIMLIPLYARLSPQEQNKIFEVKGGIRRIILATNVAETSLTVPNIRFVIDPGTARVSRYSYRSQIQCLPIEPISQASANQRKGRCGRVSAGICYRLYSEDDLLQRPLYTEPEILRTNLAQVLLQMLALKLGNPRTFPFIDAPDPRHIDHGLKVLNQLGAIDGDNRLTDIGRAMARFPIEPRLARIMLASQAYHCLAELIIIVSALSIQSPYDTPHADYLDSSSDFLTLLRLWNVFHDQKKHLSNRQFKEWCGEKGVHFLRLLEWQDVHEQLKSLARELNFEFNQREADYASLHKALLAGLIPFMGLKDEKNNYIGPRGLNFRLFYTSALNAKPPKWVMCFDFIQTRQVFSRLNAKIDPQWVEEVAPHLVKKNYFEPHWEPKRGFVCAYEKVLLLGLEIIPKRKMNYSKIDPRLCHQLFIEQGLVEGEIEGQFTFLTHNQALLEKLKTYEDRFRRKDILVEKEALKDFYALHLPVHVNNVPALKGWLHTNDETVLYFDEALLLAREVDATSDLFPKKMTIEGHLIPLQYHFSPGNQVDGVTLQMTVSQARALLRADFSGIVNGLLEEKIGALLKSLPKQIRQNLSPLQSFAGAIYEVAAGHQTNLIELIIGKIKSMTGMLLRPELFDLTKVPDFLFYRFEILNDTNETIGSGRDLNIVLEQIKISYPEFFESQFQLKKGIVSWDFGHLPQVDVDEYLALTDQHTSVAIARFEHLWQAKAAHALGVSRLLFLNALELKKYLLKAMPYKKELKEYVEDILMASFKHILSSHTEVRDPAGFEQALGWMNANAVDVAFMLAKHLYTAIQIGRKFKTNNDLLSPGFVQKVPYRYLMRYPIYFKALEMQMEKPNPVHDKTLKRLLSQYEQYQAALPDFKKGNEAWIEYRWMLEELRVSLFAQQLGTLEPISEKRLQKKWEELVKL